MKKTIVCLSTILLLGAQMTAVAAEEDPYEYPPGCDMYGCYGPYDFSNIPSEYDPNYYENLDFDWACASVGGGFMPSVTNPKYVDTSYADTTQGVWTYPEKYIQIGSYYADLYEGMDQWIVDAERSAAMFGESGKTVIADHAYQGFKAFTGTNNINIGGVNYYKVSQYNGVNTGYGINLADGRYYGDVNDGDVITYTCVGSGDDVIVAYWRVEDPNSKGVLCNSISDNTPLNNASMTPAPKTKRSPFGEKKLQRMNEKVERLGTERG